MIQTVPVTIPENRVILNQITWETFQQLLQELGNNRSSLLAYNEGMLEIMTPLGEHEHSKCFISDLIAIIADEMNLNIKKMGSLTLKKETIKKGVEPDACYYLKNEPLVRHKQDIRLDFDPPPDLILEIDMSNSSLNKLPIYAVLGVTEIWRYNGNNLTGFVLNNDSQYYEESKYSLTFSWLELSQLIPFLQQSLRDGETKTLRDFRQWVRHFT
ncbi:Uma2 family endonuclease [Cyanothece sp. BG0011]|uniref:Uma2 family endonuclease n=1 Tax=Cyanothece sp. BG0011 TaxID=2082950 RepID=UPI0018E52426|nr:Uma2 family endonuclease [Cyanothece sp. BG0011]